MKTYETWEVIKILSENPKLKFENTQEFGNRLPSIVRMFVDENGYIEVDCENCSDEVSGNIPVNGKWMLVKQSVTFMEAIKAYGEGTKIYCMIDDKKIEYTPFPGYHLLTGKGYGIKELSSYVILEGKWYIESED